MTGETLPREHLSPLAALADRALATFRYELAPFIEAVDGAVPGSKGLFHPAATSHQLRTAFEHVLDAGGETEPMPDEHESPDGAYVLYVDGGSRGNPGPAGAGAVLMSEAEAPLARLGRPIGSNAGNNVAEYAALHLGLAQLLDRHRPATLEVRTDSTTLADDVWEGRSTVDGCSEYSDAIHALLDAVPRHDWVHLADRDPNPADALATVGADVSALGP